MSFNVSMYTKNQCFSMLTRICFAIFMQNMVHVAALLSEFNAHNRKETPFCMTAAPFKPYKGFILISYFQIVYYDL